MKPRVILVLVLLFAYIGATAQQRSQVFSFSPLAKNVCQVNGLAFGVGHSYSGPEGGKINGINIEVNPLAPFFILIQDPTKGGKRNDEPIVVNGLHIAVGGFNGNGFINGVSVSAYNMGYATNGLSITALYNTCDKLNGLHLSGICNSAGNGVGALVAPINTTKAYNGLQVGLYNNAQSFTGVQIGIFNRSKEMRGLQVGLWNTNGKRSLPFINW